MTPTDKAISFNKLMELINESEFLGEGDVWPRLLANDLKRAIVSGELDHSGWVSVNERLPLVDEVVWVVVGEDYFSGYLNTKGEWVDNCRSESFAPYYVSHWQPIEPPRGRDD